MQTLLAEKCFPRASVTAPREFERFAGLKIGTWNAEPSDAREVYLMAAKPTLTAEEGGVWVVRLENDNGKVQEYRCASEQLAKQLAQVLVPRDAR
jgi:hypothetical protein